MTGGAGEPLRIEADVELTDGDRPLTFPRLGDAFLLPVPAPVAEAVPERIRSFDRLQGTVRLAIRRRDDLREAAVPATVTVETDETERAGRLRHLVAASLGPGTATPIAGLEDGRWDLVVRVDMAGLSSEAPLTAAGLGGRRARTLSHGPGPGATVRSIGPDRRLVVDVGVVRGHGTRGGLRAVRRLLERHRIPGR